MGKRRIIPGIDAVFDDENIHFLCDGEVIEDIDFTWDDLDDTELLREIAQELVEYLDEDDLDEFDNPRAAAISKLKKLRDTRGEPSGAKDGGYDDDEDEEDDY